MHSEVKAEEGRVLAAGDLAALALAIMRPPDGDAEGKFVRKIQQ